MKILIIEDERTLADSLKLILTSKGFESEAVYDGESGEEYAMLGIYDLIILDIMLPFRNGYQVAKDIRKKHISVPILMLTARSEIEDKVRGLDSGADYYLTMPFDSSELLATVNALLRRQGTQVNELVFGNTHLDLESAELACDNNSVSLSAREFEVMRLLMISGKKSHFKGIPADKGVGLRFKCSGEPCGGVCGISSQKAFKHRFGYTHRSSAADGLSSGV